MSTPLNPSGNAPNLSSGGSKSLLPTLIIALLVWVVANGGGGPPSGKIAYTYGYFNYNIHVMDSDGENSIQLTDWESVEAEAAWLPDGSQIVFGSDYEGYVNIYIMNADGSGIRQLTQDEGDSYGPDVSPACAGQSGNCTTWIAFHSNRDGFFNLYMMDSKGGNVTRLTENDADDLYPSWSPDGTKLAFMSNRDDYAFDIYVLDIVSGEIQRYTEALGIADVLPDWSPDGRQIAFSSDREFWYFIYIMDADCSPSCGGNMQQVTGGDVGFDLYPSWSSDGQWLAFAAFGRELDVNAGEGAFDFEVYAVRPDGNDLKQLTVNEEDDTEPVWSP